MNALTKYEVAPMIGFDDIKRMADVMASSRLFGIQTPEQYMTLMFLAQAEGQHPATVAQDYDIIQGKPARKTHSVLARYQAAGGSVQWHDFTETKVSGTFTHPKGGSLKVEWTIEMAVKAQLASKDNWKKTPRAMLRARCIAEGVRATYPAALGGQLIVEEAADLVLGAEAATPKDMGMAEEVRTPSASEQPVWPDEAFSAQFPRWEKAVQAGLKSVDDILTLAKTKGALTQMQEAAIRALKAPAPAGEEDPFVAEMEPPSKGGTQ
jgi:hypothetical protein